MTLKYISLLDRFSQLCILHKKRAYHNLTNVIVKEYFSLKFLIGTRFKKPFPLSALGSSMPTFVQKVYSAIQ